VLDVKQSIIQSEIVQRASTGEACNPLRGDRKDVNVMGGRTFYIIAASQPIPLGIGIMKTRESKSPPDDKLLDINNDGRADTFFSCATAEGIQFSIWTGVAYKSDMQWSSYYYLGYDTEANCPTMSDKTK
jgi:hypothetical protein